MNPNHLFHKNKADRTASKVSIVTTTAPKFTEIKQTFEWKLTRCKRKQNSNKNGSTRRHTKGKIPNKRHTKNFLAIIKVLKETSIP